MAILDLLDKPVFSSRFKLHVHVIQVVLVIIMIGLSVPRLFIKNQPRTRTSTIALGMGAKSLIILAYILLSEYVPRFQRWHSYKAIAILSCLEVLFWSGVAGLTFQANMKYCQGVTCALSWVVFVIAVIVVNTEIYTAAISIREFREYKRGTKRTMITSMDETTRRHRHKSDEEQMMQPVSARVEEPKQAYAQTERQRSERSRDQNGWRTPEYQQPGWRTSERRQSQQGEYVQHVSVQHVSAPPRYTQQ